MRKLIPVFTLVILSMVVTLLTGCTSRALAAEVAQSLIQTNKSAVENIDSDITNIDKQLYDTQTRLLNLEQLLSSALEWIDYQKNIPRKAGKWDVRVTQSGLAKLQNDHFKVTSLKAIITSDGNKATEISYTIDVFDLRKMRTDNPVTFQNNLLDEQNLLESKRKAMTDARDLSVLTMNNILKYTNDWKIKKISGTTYSVSGPGLGWSDQLTDGTWQYNRDKGTLVPDGKEANELYKIILVK